MDIKYFSANQIYYIINLFQTIYGSASTPLEDNENNYHGWESVMLDPDEEGASKLVKMIGNSSKLNRQFFKSKYIIVSQLQMNTHCHT